jgi:Transposase DDE domain
MMGRLNRDQEQSRAAKEYLATLDDAAYGAASPVTPKFISPSDPAAQWTGAMNGAAFFAYADNYLIDVKFGIIMDVEASRAIRQAEVGASRTMIERTEATFGIKPEWLAGDTAYGSAPNLHWLVNTKGIAPYIPVIDKSQREDGTFSREDFVYDAERDAYTCPAGKTLTTTGNVNADNGIRYIASVPVCRACPLKPNCCPNMPSRRIVRDVHEAARDVARALAKTKAYELSRHLRKKVEFCTFEAHPASRSPATAWPQWSAVRVHACRHRTEPAPPRQAHHTCAAGACVRERFVSSALWHSYSSVASRASMPVR